MQQLRVGFDGFFPVVRYGPLFHILRLEHPQLRIDWEPRGFPARDGSLLGDADVGVFVQPPRRANLNTLTLDLSPMVVLTSVGHRLAQRPRLRVVDILNEPFLAAREADPEWAAFWTLDEQRGGPPELTGEVVENAWHGLEAVARGRAIATIPAWATDGPPHPGVVPLLLSDGPSVATSLLWRADDRNLLIRALIDLADDLTRTRRDAAQRQQHEQVVLPG